MYNHLFHTGIISFHLYSAEAGVPAVSLASGASPTALPAALPAASSSVSGYLFRHSLKSPLLAFLLPAHFKKKTHKNRSDSALSLISRHVSYLITCPKKPPPCDGHAKKRFD